MFIYTILDKSNCNLYNTKIIQKLQLDLSRIVSFSKDKDVVIKFTSTELFDPNDGKGFELIITYLNISPRIGLFLNFCLIVKTICALKISLNVMELIIMEIIETKKIAKDLIIIIIIMTF